MAIAAISKISAASGGTYNSAPQLKDSLAGFQAALKTGDLQAAADALTRIQQDLRRPANSNGVQGSASANPENTVSRDVQALQEAFDAEDLSAVKAAFAKLQDDTQQITKAQQKGVTTSADEAAGGELLPPLNASEGKATGNLVDVYA